MKLLLVFDVLLQIYLLLKFIVSLKCVEFAWENVEGQRIMKRKMSKYDLNLRSVRKYKRCSKKFNFEFKEFKYVR